MERSKFAPDDILSLISLNAFVKLGEWKDVSYLLMYSLVEDDVKIILVSEKDKAVVSVWDKDYVLPRKVKQVTNRLVYDVKQKFWLAILELRKNDPARLKEKERQVQVIVKKGKTAEYSTTPIPIPYELSLHVKDIVAFYASTLLNIAEAVASSEHNYSKVRYELRILHTESGKLAQGIHLKHESLMNYLSSATKSP